MATPRDPNHVHPRRLTAVSMALLLVAALATPALAGANPGQGRKAAGDDLRPSQRAVTLVNYNIAHGRGMDDVVDLGRIAGVLEDAGAQVVTLQEVDRHWSERSGYEDQPARLADLLDMHHAYGANLDLPPLIEGYPNRQYGTATLSEHRILQWRNTLLPLPPGEEQRGLLEVLLDVDGRQLWVLNTHLTHVSAEGRAAQVEAILDRVAQLRGPVVLTGDLNAEPGAPELAPLFEVFDDAWDLAGQGQGFTFPTLDPDRRIDYVLVTPGIEVRRAEVLDTLASDHLPVLVELVVSPSAAGQRRAAEARQRLGRP